MRDSLSINIIAQIPDSRGKLMISEAPGRQDTYQNRNLAEDLKTIKSQDVQVIVCLLEWWEMHKLGLQEYPREVQNNNIVFYHFPIACRESPKTKNIISITNIIIKHLANGDNVLVHCREGLSRAGLVCACCLTHYHYQAYNAISEVKKRRRGALNSQCYNDTIENYCTIINNIKRKCYR